MPRYSPVIKEQMQAFYHSLSEKERRRYAAIEACTLGQGGISYIARVLACDRQTLTQGRRELTDPEALQQTRIRRVGGGRKPCHEVIPGLADAFLQVLQDHTAGSPMKATGKWTNLTQQEIADRLATEHGITVSVTVVKRLLRQHDFVRRKAQTRQRTGACVDRDAQCTTIARLKEEYAACGKPIVSSDTKNKH